MPALRFRCDAHATFLFACLHDDFLHKHNGCLPHHVLACVLAAFFGFVPCVLWCALPASHSTVFVSYCLSGEAASFSRTGQMDCLTNDSSSESATNLGRRPATTRYTCIQLIPGHCCVDEKSCDGTVTTLGLKGRKLILISASKIFLEQVRITINSLI